MQEEEGRLEEKNADLFWSCLVMILVDHPSGDPWQQLDMWMRR